MALQWTNCTNPAPELGNKTSWVLTGVTDSRATITIVIGDDTVVSHDTPTLIGDDNSGNNTYAFSVTLKALTESGLTTVEASESDNGSVSAPLIIGEMLAYDTDGTLYTAQSQHWVLVTDTPPDTFPTQSAMGQNGLAYATWDTTSYVLNWGPMNNQMSDTEMEDNQFFISGDVSGTYTPGDFPKVLWAYDDFGNLWQAPASAWGEASDLVVPPPASSSDPYTVAWVPDPDPPKDPGDPPTDIIVNVTCYLLDWGEAERVRNGDTFDDGGGTPPVVMTTTLSS